MSAQPTHDLAIKTGEYADRQTGQQKGRWLRIGTVFRHDDGGTSIKLDALPVGLTGWEGWVNVFPRGQGQTHNQPPAHGRRGNGGSYADVRDGRAAAPPQHPPYADFDDEIPF